MEKIIVYTCITDGKDILKEYEPEAGIDYVCYTDGSASSKTGQWITAPLQYSNIDPRRTSRYHKMFPDKILPDHDWSMWIDGSMIPRVRIRDIIEWMKKDENAVFAIRPHPGWNCIYKEAQAISHYGFEDNEILEKVVKRYRNEGFPENYGLHETGVLIRKNIGDNQRFCKMWWDEISENSKRDQMSFDYLRWKTGKKFLLLPRNWFRIEAHSHGK